MNFCSLIEPNTSIYYGSYFSTVLSVSGVLFGLTFTGLLFVIQSGFSSFKFSRRMFLELYVHFGTALLVSLAYLTFVTVIVQFAKHQWWLVNTCYWVFSLSFATATLRHHKHIGYIHTIFSDRYVPREYGSTRRFFRYIWNLGLPANIFIYLILVFVVFYPVAVSKCEAGSFSLTEKGLWLSTLIVLAYSLLKITRFIPEFFKLSNEELEAKGVDRIEESNPSVDPLVEKQAFVKYLEGHGINEINPVYAKDFLDGDIWLSILHTDKPEIWINAHVEVNDVTPFSLIEAVHEYAYGVFSLFQNSQIDLNSIVLSFHVRIAGETTSRNVFFRSNRMELTRFRGHLILWEGGATDVTEKRPVLC